MHKIENSSTTNSPQAVTCYLQTDIKPLCFSDMKNLIGEASCRICQESFSTTITGMSLLFILNCKTVKYLKLNDFKAKSEWVLKLCYDSYFVKILLPVNLDIQLSLCFSNAVLWYFIYFIMFCSFVRGHRYVSGSYGFSSS